MESPDPSESDDALPNPLPEERLVKPVTQDPHMRNHINSPRFRKSVDGVVNARIAARAAELDARKRAAGAKAAEKWLGDGPVQLGWRARGIR